MPIPNVANWTTLKILPTKGSLMKKLAKGAQRRIAVVGVALLAVAGISLVTPAVASATVYTTPGASKAVAYASSVGVHSGVAILDKKTGKLYGAGAYGSKFGSASVVKLFVATKLLATGQMTASRATIAYKMITQSDDASLNKLLPLVGGTSVVNWVASYYHITNLGSPATKPCWGNTHITATGIAHFYTKMQADPKVGPWLTNAVHHYTAYGSDGTDQRFGIPSATTGAGIKQGWGKCSADYPYTSVIHSTGIVNSNRFAVAILTETTHGYVNSNVYNAWEAAVVTKMAKLIMPGGKVDLPEYHNPKGRVDSASVSGNVFAFKGWTFDPDLKSGTIYVRLYDGSTLVWMAKTNIYRADVNTAYHITGYHGFSKSITATVAGTHRYCVRFVNYSYGTASPQYCYSVNVVIA
jgi:hypothetical protein